MSDYSERATVGDSREVKRKTYESGSAETGKQNTRMLRLTRSEREFEGDDDCSFLSKETALRTTWRPNSRHGAFTAQNMESSSFQSCLASGFGF